MQYIVGTNAPIHPCRTSTKENRDSSSCRIDTDSVDQLSVHVFILDCHNTKIDQHRTATTCHGRRRHHGRSKFQFQFARTGRGLNTVQDVEVQLGRIFADPTAVFDFLTVSGHQSDHIFGRNWQFQQLLQEIVVLLLLLLLITSQVSQIDQSVHENGRQQHVFGFIKDIGKFGRIR